MTSASEAENGILQSLHVADLGATYQAQFRSMLHTISENNPDGLVQLDEKLKQVNLDPNNPAFEGNVFRAINSTAGLDQIDRRTIASAMGREPTPGQFPATPETTNLLKGLLQSSTLVAQGQMAIASGPTDTQGRSTFGVLVTGAEPGSFAAGAGAPIHDPKPPAPLPPSTTPSLGVLDTVDAGVRFLANGIVEGVTYVGTQVGLSDRVYNADEFAGAMSAKTGVTDNFALTTDTAEQNTAKQIAKTEALGQQMPVIQTALGVTGNVIGAVSTVAVAAQTTIAVGGVVAAAVLPVAGGTALELGAGALALESAGAGLALEGGAAVVEGGTALEIAGAGRALVPLAERALVPAAERALVPAAERALVPSAERALIPAAERVPLTLNLAPTASRGLLGPLALAAGVGGVILSADNGGAPAVAAVPAPPPPPVTVQTRYGQGANRMMVDQQGTLIEASSAIAAKLEPLSNVMAGDLNVDMTVGVDSTGTAAENGNALVSRMDAQLNTLKRGSRQNLTGLKAEVHFVDGNGHKVGDYDVSIGADGKETFVKQGAQAGTPQAQPMDLNGLKAKLAGDIKADGAVGQKGAGDQTHRFGEMKVAKRPTIAAPGA